MREHCSDEMRGKDLYDVLVENQRDRIKMNEIRGFRRREGASKSLELLRYVRDSEIYMRTMKHTDTH